MTAYTTRYGAPIDPAPRVSIITTVYDRVACLARCLRSIERSGYRDLEHIVVSDAPGEAVESEILRLVEGDPRRRYLALELRANNWGITPAAVGLRAAVGEFVCFLSDDNAYLPDHFAPLVAALDKAPTLGFVYSGCEYASPRGKTRLRADPPVGGRIDLGQPLFRRAAIERHSPDLPFAHHAWDWSLIQTLMQHGERWRFIDQPTFVFNVAEYPEIRQSLEAAS